MQEKNWLYLKIKRVISGVTLCLVIAVYFAFVLCTSSLAASTITVKSEADSTDIEFKMPPIDWQYAGLDSFPQLPDAPFITLADAPELPKLIYTFLSEASKSYEVKILSVQDTIVEASIAPSRGFVSFDEKDIERKKGPEYVTNAFFPATSFHLNNEFCARATFGRVLEIYPFQYNAVAKKLRITKSIKIRVYHAGNQLKNGQLIQKSALIDSDLTWLDSGNYGSMLVVAPDSFKVELQPFIAWKKQKGIPVYFVACDTITGDSGLKQVVSKYYSEKNILYLLLAGDHQQVPAYSGLYGTGDNHYGYLVGNDYYQDVLVGRLPAETRNQLAAMVSKSVQYEKGLGLGNNIVNFLGIASNESNTGDQGETDLQHIRNIETELKKVNFSSSLVSPALEASKSISTQINSGCGIICYAGHGNEYMLKTNSYGFDSIANLTNDNCYPVFIDVACLNGSFTRTTCFSEKIMRAQHDNQAAGTVAILASTISQPWNPPMSGQDEMIKQIVGSSQYGKSYTLGTVCSGGFFKMINDYGTGGMETAATWNLFGDPSLLLWTSIPQQMVIASDDQLNVRSEYFQVRGVDNTLVTLYMNDQILDTDVIQNGTASLYPGTVTLTDSVMLTAVNPGYIPVQKVLPPFSDGGPYYGMHGFVLVDQNGIIENNETFTFQPKITNHGNSTGENIAVEIVGYDACFEIDYQRVVCDSINPNATEVLPGFSITTTAGNADQTKGSIHFKVSDESGQVNYFTKELTINAPVLSIDKVLVNGEELTGNEFVFNEESLVVQFIVSNSGYGPASNITGAFLLESFYIDYETDPEFDFSIAPRTTDTLRFDLSVNPDVESGETVVASVILDDVNLQYTFGLIARQRLEIIVGDQQFSIPEYPFYNYYKSNRSQFLIRSEELSLDSPIDSIGFYISSFPNTESQRSFLDLQIRFLLTTDSILGAYYMAMDSSALVALYSSFKMPLKEGWVNFDVSDFSVPAGKNLIVELLWGPNIYTTSYQSSFEVFAHKTDFVSTVFGYHDTQYPPPVRNFDRYRPDFRLIPKPEGKRLVAVELLTDNQVPYYNYQLKIGSQRILSDADGIVNLLLPEGSFPVTLFDGVEILLADTLRVGADSDTISFVLNTRGQVLGMEQIAETAEILYDNQYLTVSLKGGEQQALIELYSTTGARIWRKIVCDRQRIYMGNLSRGVYLVSINRKINTKIINY